MNILGIKSSPLSKFKKSIFITEHVAIFVGTFSLLKTLAALSGVRLFYAASWPDPFIYTGYAINFSGILHRYGGTYYGARISTILPTWLRFKLNFSDQNFRLMILAGFAVAFYIAFRIKASRVLAGFYALTAASSILILRYISDDYMPGFVSLFSIITLSTLLRSSSSKEHRLQWIGLSGFGFGLAFNSNVSIVVLLVPWILTYLWSQNALHNTNRFAEIKIFAIYATLSQIICLAIGIHFGGLGSLRNYKATIGAIRNLKLYESLFSRPVAQVSSFILLYFCLTLLILIITAKEAHQNLTEISLFEFRKKKVIYSACISTLATLVTGLIYYSLLSHSWFTTSFYAFLYFPIIIIPVYLWLIQKNRSVYVPLIVIFFTYFIIANSHALNKFKMNEVSNMRAFLLGLFVISLLIPLLYHSRIGIKLMTVYVLVFSSTFMLTQDWNPYWITRSQNQFDGEFAGYLNYSNQIVNESTQYFAEDFAKFLKESIPESEYFWLVYPENPSWLLSLDATQLWGYSCFACTDKNGYPIAREFPPTAANNLSTLKSRRFTVIFSSSSTMQQQALTKYLHSYTGTKNIKNRVFSHMNQSLFVNVVDNKI